MNTKYTQLSLNINFSDVSDTVRDTVLGGIHNHLENKGIASRTSVNTSEETLSGLATATMSLTTQDVRPSGDLRQSIVDVCKSLQEEMSGIVVFAHDAFYNTQVSINRSPMTYEA